MTDLSNPMDVIRSRARSLHQTGHNLRREAALLIARAEQAEKHAYEIEGDIRDIERWAPKSLAETLEWLRAEGLVIDADEQDARSAYAQRHGPS